MIVRLDWQNIWLASFQFFRNTCCGQSFPIHYKFLIVSWYVDIWFSSKLLQMFCWCDEAHGAVTDAESEGFFSKPFLDNVIKLWYIDQS